MEIDQKWLLAERSNIMDKMQKLADFVMSEKFDKYVIGAVLMFFLYLIIQLIRWFV